MNKDNTTHPIDIPSDVVLDGNRLLELTTKLVTSYLVKNPMDPSMVPNLIKEVHLSLEELNKTEVEAQTGIGNIPIKKTVNPDYIICLEDGKKLKMLKRHLRTNFGLTPEEYRAKWGLPSDYPMVAPNYAKRRSEFAKKIGLGRSSS